MGRVLELDGLRAVAIILVLGCHYKGFATLAGDLPEFGWLGVDIFFVLSGYLITTILLGLRDTQSPYKTFYSRRLLRILPPYIAVTAAIILIGGASQQYWVFSGKFFIHQAFFLQAYPFLFGHAVLDFLRHPRISLSHFPRMIAHWAVPPLGARGLTMQLSSVQGTYWSLSIEEYFYLLWAPVVLRCTRSRVAWIGVSICLAEALLRWTDGTMLAYFSLFYHLDALLYGGLLALLLNHWKRSSLPRWWSKSLYAVFGSSMLGLVAVLAAIRPVIGYEVREYPLFLVVGLPLLYIAISALIGLIILKSGSSWWLARVLRQGPLQYLGTISYSMYLVHVLSGIAICRVILFLTGQDRYPLLQAVTASILTVGIARCSWHFIEKPILRWKDIHFASPHPPEPVLD